MNCPNCGKGEQQAATYCRQCGILQPDPSRPYSFPHLSKTFEQINVVISAACGLASFILAAILWLVILGFGGGSMIHLMALTAVAVGLWCAYASWRNFNLQKDFRCGKRESTGHLAPSESGTITDRLLDIPDFENVVPPSVTDSTTRHLVESQKVILVHQHVRKNTSAAGNMIWR
jgi:hypothetical protein